MAGQRNNGHAKRSVLGAVFLSVQLAFGLGGTAAGASSLPRLTANGVGSMHFGRSKESTVAALTKVLGVPNARGVNTGCGPQFTEVAWHDLILEFRNGRFTGYRYIDGGWPLATPHDRVTAKGPLPRLRTGSGLTLGSTLAEARAAYKHFVQAGAVKWKAENGMVFVVSSTAHNPSAPSNRLVEIKVGTCGSY